MNEICRQFKSSKLLQYNQTSNWRQNQLEKKIKITLVCIVLIKTCFNTLIKIPIFYKYQGVESKESSYNIRTVSV